MTRSITTSLPAAFPNYYPQVWPRPSSSVSSEEGSPGLFHSLSPSSRSPTAALSSLPTRLSTSLSTPRLVAGLLLPPTTTSPTAGPEDRHALYRSVSLTSVHAVLSTISSHIQTRRLYDFRIYSSPEVLNDHEIKNLLHHAIQDNKIRGVTVSSENPSVKLHTMARPLHDAISALAYDFLLHN